MLITATTIEKYSHATIVLLFVAHRLWQQLDRLLINDSYGQGLGLDVVWTKQPQSLRIVWSKRLTLTTGSLLHNTTRLHYGGSLQAMGFPSISPDLAFAAFDGQWVFTFATTL